MSPDLTPPDAPGPIPMADFRRHVADLYAPPLRAPATRTGVLFALAQLEAGGARTTADLTTAAIARFLAARPEGEHPNYTHTLLARVRVLCNLAAAEGWVRVSPFAVRKRWVRRVRPTPPRHSRRRS